MELARIELEKTVEFLTGRILAMNRESDALLAEAREIRIYQEHLIRQVERMVSEVCAECGNARYVKKPNSEFAFLPCPSCQGGSE